MRPYLNEKLGFVRLEYVNIDGSKMTMHLAEIRATK